MIGASQGVMGTRRDVRRQARAQRAAASTRSYADERGQLRTGDVLLFRGRGPMSMLIRYLTHSPYSHVALVFRFEGRVYCLEAVGVGVRLCLMSEALERYHGGIDHFDVPGATEEQRHGALSYAFQQLGKLYDRPGLWRFLFAILFGRKPRVREDQAWFCSELVASAYRKHGLALVPVSAAFTSPADLALSPELKLRCIVKREA
jgi:uncharacterized protein YycO